MTRNIAHFALLGLILLATATLGATMDGPDVPIDKPIQRVNDPGHCYEAEVKMLRWATDTTQPLEDMQKERLAADAYDRLDTLGQLC